MSEGDENRSGRRRLDPRYWYDPSWSHHPDYRGNKSRSKSPSKSSNNSPPSFFDNEYSAIMAAQTTKSSSPQNKSSSAAEASPTAKGKAANSKNQPASSPPAEPQLSNALTVTGSQDQQVVKWSSTVRPGPYDAANMPQEGQRYTEEENWRIAWGYADGVHLNQLWERVPNRKGSRGPGAHWRVHLAKKKEFAWAQPLRDANLKKESEEKQQEKQQEIQQEKQNKLRQDNAERMRLMAEFKADREQKKQGKDEEEKERKRKPKEMGKSGGAKRGGAGGNK